MLTTKYTTILLDTAKQKLYQADELVKIAKKIEPVIDSEIRISKLPCPGDKKHELSLAYNSKGILFVCCNANCDWRDICSVLGIEPEDFFVSPFWKSKKKKEIYKV